MRFTFEEKQNREVAPSLSVLRTQRLLLLETSVVYLCNAVRLKVFMVVGYSRVLGRGTSYGSSRPQPFASRRDVPPCIGTSWRPSGCGAPGGRSKLPPDD